MARPKSLKWIGPMDWSGVPARWMPGIPARDLDESDIAQLSDELFADAMSCGFYEAPSVTNKKTADAAKED